MSERRRQKLDVVFELACEQDRDEIKSGTNRLGRSIRVGGISDSHALQIVIDTMGRFGISDIYEHGKRSSAKSYLAKIEEQGKWTRAIEAGGLLFRFGHVVALKHSFLSIEEVVAGSAVSWMDWVKPFLAEDRLVQAWISDVEYDYWQNVKDTLQYQAVGRSYSGLPTKSNGLPAPLEQIEIDTSNNPGRRSLRVGYVEAIGSPMWLAPLFWKLVGENKIDLLRSTHEFDVRSIENRIVQVNASENCFCDDTTTHTQNRLRAVLYS